MFAAKKSLGKFLEPFQPFHFIYYIQSSLATTTKLVSFYFCHKKLTLEKCGDKRAFIYACIVLSPRDSGEGI
jgi:hypothetical protein